jgi:hypothetical protein
MSQGVVNSCTMIRFCSTLAEVKYPERTCRIGDDCRKETKNTYNTKGQKEKKKNSSECENLYRNIYLTSLEHHEEDSFLSE